MSISLPIVRRISRACLRSVETVRKPARNPKEKGDLKNAIHDDRQAPREPRFAAQGAYGCYCEVRRRGSQNRQDARERRGWGKLTWGARPRRPWGTARPWTALHPRSGGQRRALQRVACN